MWLATGNSIVNRLPWPIWLRTITRSKVCDHFRRRRGLLDAEGGTDAQQRLLNLPEPAAEAGANVMVTACPFCMVNIEDAIKVAGLEGKMTAIDLAELVDQHIVRDGLVVAVC